MKRTAKEILKDLDKLTKGYESATDPNSSMRFCVYKSYDMYWLMLEIRELLSNIREEGD